MLRFETSGKQRVVRIVVVWRIERKKTGIAAGRFPSDFQ
jgi:hypothetical protein